MEQWDDPVRKEHRALEVQVGQLAATLRLDEVDDEYRMILRAMVGGLRAMLEQHLAREERALFPVLERLLGQQASTVALLHTEHQALRTHLQRLTELLHRDGPPPRREISEEGRQFIELLHNHEKTEDRLLLDVLRYSLPPAELDLISRSLAGETPMR